MDTSTKIASRLTRRVVASIVLFVLISAARDVFLSQLLRGSLLVSEVMFLTFVPVCLATNLIRWSGHSTGGVPQLYSRTSAHFTNLIKLNVWTAILYISIYLSLALLLPATTDTIGIGLIPFFLFGITKQLRTRWRPCLVVLTGALIASASAVLADLQVKPTLTALGLGLAGFAAYSAAYCIIYAGRLNAAKVIPYQVFASRFWMLLIASLVWSITERSLQGQWGAILNIRPETVGVTLLVGIVGIALPLYVMHHLIAGDPEKRYVPFAVALIPVAVFFMQLPWAEFSWLSLVGVIVVGFGCYFGMRPTNR